MAKSQKEQHDIFFTFMNKVLDNYDTTGSYKTKMTPDESEAAAYMANGKGMSGQEYAMEWLKELGHLKTKK